MKILFLVTALATGTAALAASNSVSGYIKKDGTYVAPHYRSNPNTSRTDNYSSQGNYNPYTGQSGTVDPYAPKEPSNPYATKRTNAWPN